MNMLPRPTDPRHPYPPIRRRVVNLVPTPATRALAAEVIYQAEQRTGPDAALVALEKVSPDQLPALLGIVLTATKVHKKVGRPRVPLQFTAEERRQAHTAHKNGDKSAWAQAGEREYQRVNQRQRRARLKAAVI
jgi:hypothetical protein